MGYGWQALHDDYQRDPFQLFSAVAFPILLTLVFTYLFGVALAGTTEHYLQFSLPCSVEQTPLPSFEDYFPA